MRYSGLADIWISIWSKQLPIPCLTLVLAHGQNCVTQNLCKWDCTNNWLLLNNTMNTIQHNNTIQFPQKTLKFYKIVLCYCVVLRCWCFFCFFKLFPKQHNAIILFMPPCIVFLKLIQYHEHNTIQ